MTSWTLNICFTSKILSPQIYPSLSTPLSPLSCVPLLKVTFFFLLALLSLCSFCPSPNLMHSSLSAKCPPRPPLFLVPPFNPLSPTNRIIRTTFPKIVMALRCVWSFYLFLPPRTRPPPHPVPFSKGNRGTVPPLPGPWRTMWLLNDDGLSLPFPKRRFNTLIGKFFCPPRHSFRFPPQPLAPGRFLWSPRPSSFSWFWARGTSSLVNPPDFQFWPAQKKQMHLQLFLHPPPAPP